MFASDVLFIFGILRHEIEINHLKNIDSRHVTNRDDLGLVLTYSAVFDTSGFPPSMYDNTFDTTRKLKLFDLQNKLKCTEIP